MNAPQKTTGSRGPLRAVLALLVVTLIWGATFVWMKQAVSASARVLGEQAGASSLALFLVLRFGSSALFLLVFVAPARRAWNRASWVGGLWLGLLLFVGFALQMAGLEQVSPAVSAFLTSLYVLFTALLSTLVERKAMRVSLFVGAVLATLGAYLIRGRPEFSMHWGELLTVVSAFIFAVHILATDRITKRVPAMPVTFTTFVWVALASAVLLVCAQLRDRAPTYAQLFALTSERDFVLPLALSSLLATVIALSLMNLYQRQLDPLRAAILYALEPIWAALFGVLCGLDAWTSWLWVGGSILLAGNLVAELGTKRVDPGPKTAT